MDEEYQTMTQHKCKGGLLNISMFFFIRMIQMSLTGLEEHLQKSKKPYRRESLVSVNYMAHKISI